MSSNLCQVFQSHFENTISVAYMAALDEDVRGYARTLFTEFPVAKFARKPEVPITYDPHN